MNDLFLRSCRGDAVPRRPVWLMRQAGRYMPEYRAVRAQTDFLTLCRTPELVAEVTLQPVDILGVDAAIIFADILLVPEAMGGQLSFQPGDGPVFANPIRSREDLAQLHIPDVDKTLGYVFDALRLTRQRLGGRVPLLGFAGTPWTLAAYMVEGGTSKVFHHLLSWSYRDPNGLAELLDQIAEVTIHYLKGQVKAGAQALQLFDTWGGLLSLERWQSLALPSLQRIVEALSGSVPLIYYGNGTGHLLPALADLPVEVLSVDWRLPLSHVRNQVGEGKVLQGNLDPATLLAPPEVIRQRVQEMIDDGRGGAHIANLGHGIWPMTPVPHAKAFVDAVRGIATD